jgi:hypothetical protein
MTRYARRCCARRSAQRLGPVPMRPPPIGSTSDWPRSGSSPPPGSPYRRRSLRPQAARRSRARDDPATLRAGLAARAQGSVTSCSTSSSHPERTTARALKPLRRRRNRASGRSGTWPTESVSITRSAVHTSSDPGYVPLRGGSCSSPCAGQRVVLTMPSGVRLALPLRLVGWCRAGPWSFG